MRGCVLILSGPSGVGKDTVLEAWQQHNHRVQRVVAYTTREMREGEIDGKDYHFVTHPAFKEMADHGAFLEHKLVHANFYATPLKDMEKLVGSGKIAVLKIDVQGALTVMELRPDVLTVILQPPSWEELERRIRGRATDDAATIEKRLITAREEIEFADRYQLRLVNDDLFRTVAALDEWVGDRVVG